jgi:hypothetical protein
MNFRNAAVAVALAVSLVPLAARADGWNTGSASSTDWTQGWSTGSSHAAEASGQRDLWEGHGHDRHHRHDAHCHVQHRGGRYELQNVQRWVDGQYQQYWVEPRCRTVTRDRDHRHGHGRRWGRERTKTVCTEGYYATRFVPGHYETVQEWVWVPYSPRFGVHVSVPLGR